MTVDVRCLTCPVYIETLITRVNTRCLVILVALGEFPFLFSKLCVSCFNKGFCADVTTKPCTSSTSVGRGLPSLYIQPVG